MRSAVIATVLCIFAAAAAAQCVGRQASAATAARPGPALITTASAATRESALSPDDELPAMRDTAAAAKPAEKNDSRHGPAMLLAALAVMSGIALRRYIARMQ